jgi:hypothetical protein
MQVYIFRILSEEEETFVREIALSENNTLLDFHTILTDSTGLNNKLLASFYLTSRQWEKQKEFTLLDMELDNDTNNRPIEENIPIDMMSHAHIGDIIEDQKQRMIYEYNFLYPLLFFLSLVEIKEVEDDEKYPKVLFSEGQLDSELLQEQDDFFAEQEGGFNPLEEFMEEDYDEDDLSLLGYDEDDEDFGKSYDGDSYDDGY